MQRLRAAGAIILGKTNLTEMIRDALDSSLGGRTLNPWDVTRTPGESSSGTGAALAADFALLGTGTDNGQSIRSPASAGGIVGMKPTIGLVSCAGVLPSSLSNNACGPLARSVSDLAHLLDAMAGFDPRDFMTRLALGQTAKTYTSFLDADGLRGARLGSVVELLGEDPEHAEVNRVFSEATTAMAGLGATVLPIKIPNMNDYRVSTRQLRSLGSPAGMVRRARTHVAVSRRRRLSREGNVQSGHRAPAPPAAGERRAGAFRGVSANAAQDA